MEKKENITTDDQLFDMQREARRKKKRKLIIILISVLVVVVLTIIIGVTMLRKKVTAQVNSSDSSAVQSQEVTRGSISTTVSGSGTLTDENATDVEVLSSIEVVDYYVEDGDYVEAGDLIATVTNASVLTAMSAKQEELDELDKEIKSASGDTASTTLSSSVTGRVKKVFVSSGDDVLSKMYENGALILLSLDGYMAVDVANEKLTEGQSVSVTLSNGSSVSGTVEKQNNGVATVLVTDNGTVYNDQVTVYDSEGTAAGEGTLYIHSQMAITGYAGTVSYVYISDNQKVYNGTTLLTLKDTETSANYDALLKEREELEEQLHDLIKIYKEGGVCAEIAGTITGMSGEQETESTQSSEMSMYGASVEVNASSGTYTTIATISSETTMAVTISVDENNILSVEEGQKASVSIDSIEEKTFEATVTDISTEATSSSGVTSYSATVSFEKTKEMLSGMSASVVITIEGVDDALLIPVEALHQTSSTAYVYTEYDEGTGEFGGMVEVKVGLSNSSYVEITEGLNEGDVVYYTETEESGFDFAMPGGGGMPDMGGMDMSEFPGGGSFPGGSSGGSFPGGSMPGGSSGGGFPSGMPGSN